MSSSVAQSLAVLAFRNFRLYLAARFLITMGGSIIAVIVGWQVYSITRDVLSLGLIGLAEAVPALSLALWGGYVADHYNTRKVLLRSIGLLLTCGVLLVLLSTRMGWLIHTGTEWPFYAIMMLLGFATGFLSPSLFSLLSQLIPRQHYASSAPWSSTSWQSAAVAGPASAGLIYGYAGPVPTYLLVCVCLAAAGLCMLAIKPTSPAKPIPTQREPFTTNFLAGLRFVFTTPVLLGALALDLFAVFFAGAEAMLPAFCDQVLLQGPEGLGLLRAAPAAGALIIAVLTLFFPPRRHAGAKLLLAVAGFGACMVGFGLSTSFLLSLGLLFVAGCLDSFSVVIRSIILQLYTPDAMRGRVSAVNMLFIGSSNELGAVESGVAARLLGLQPSVVGGGLVVFVVVLLLGSMVPQLRHLQLTSTRAV